MIVLVDHARPERLGDLVRSLLPAHPDLEVHTSALRLAGAEKGSLVILVPDPAHASWMNQERPIFANRELRVILFSETATSVVLARRAPDFFSWISHRLECPEGTPRFAVRGVRAALCARARGVAWTGGDLDGVFAAALPGRALVKVSSAIAYDEMVEAAKPAGKGWVAWSEVDGPFRSRRVRWASAEAGRRGRTVLVEPTVETPGFVPVHGKPLGIAEARGKLEEAGAKHPGRLAALLELEPEAVEVAAALLRAGMEEAKVEAAALRAEDPGVAVARMALPLEAGATLRARMQRTVVAKADPIEALLHARHGNADHWIEAAEGAISVGDSSVATRWAQYALDLQGENPKALQVAGRALERQGSYADAAKLLEKSIEIAERIGPRGEAYAKALTDLARILEYRGEYLEAERLLRRALATQKRVAGSNHPSYAISLYGLGTVLRARGRHEESEKLLKRSANIIKATIVKSHPNYANAIYALGSISLERGKFSAAEKLFREAIEFTKRDAAANPLDYATKLHNLGHVLVEQQRYEEADSILREALKATATTFGSKHPSYAISAYELARCVAAQGSYSEAERLIQESLSIYEDSIGTKNPLYAASMHELANIQLHRGQYRDAEEILRKVLQTEQEAFGNEHPVLCGILGSLAMVLALQGRVDEGEKFAARSVAIADKAVAPVSADAAQSLLVLAQLQAERGAAEAPDTARQAIKAFNRAYGPGASVTKSAVQLLERIAQSAQT
ncbi:MAG: tetratricopeptide repeat protein [Minicystis sp.]